MNAFLNAIKPYKGFGDEFYPMLVESLSVPNSKAMVICVGESNRHSMAHTLVSITNKHGHLIGIDPYRTTYNPKNSLIRNRDNNSMIRFNAAKGYALRGMKTQPTLKIILLGVEHTKSWDDIFKGIEAYQNNNPDVIVFSRYK